MQIKKIKLNSINPARYNPRKDLQQNDPEYQKLRDSIATFGYVDPLIVNVRTNNLVGGHQRLKILIEQGIEEAEVSIVDLSPENEKALNLALNKISGDWDNDKLAVLLDELTKIPDFNVTLTGFDLPEISNILDTFFEPKEGASEIETIDEEPITREGDLIQLGDHRILCGDSSKFEDMARLMNGEKADLIFSDPPYNVNYDGDNRPVPENVGAESKSSWRKIANDNMTQADYEIWLKAVFSNMLEHLGEGGPLYVWNGHRQFGPMYIMLNALDIHVSCVLTWAKESFAPGYGDYNQQTEFCLYGWKQDNGAHKWYGPANESTLWHIKRDHTREYSHPTQKALELAHRAIKNSSKRGDIVLDSFLGSGTTLIASENMNRKCYGMEIDPRYCDVIVRRYINLIGEDNIDEDILKQYMKEVKSD